MARTGQQAGERPISADTEHRPRVLHVITHLAMGGAENVALGLVEALHPSVDFTLFAVLGTDDPGAVGRDMAARLARCDVPWRYGTRRGFKSGGVIAAAWSLIRAVEDWRPDVIHVHTEIPELTLAIAHLLSPRIRRTPILRTVHNSVLWIAWGRIGRWVTRRLHAADAVAVSRAAADADAAIVPGRARADVIYNGAKPGAARPDPDPKAPVRILFAGRMVHQKGADLLPAILERAHARTARRDVSVTIAGSGELSASVAAGLAGRLVGWRVAMTGPIAALAQRLHDHDVVLLPARFEGFGLLQLETLLAGIPLVTTRAPGIDEVIPPDYPLAAAIDDVEALGDILARTIDDPASARAIAAAHGAVLADRFAPWRTVDAYRARYAMLAARRDADMRR